MQENSGAKAPKGASPPQSAKSAREARLAKALRDNLRRRKGAPPVEPQEGGPEEGGR